MLDYEADESEPERWDIMKHTHTRVGEDQFFLVVNGVVEESGLYRGEVDEMVKRARDGIVIEVDER